jgi:hypothetical protein
VYCFVDRCLSFCPFSFCHCVVCPSSIYGFRLFLWFRQILLHNWSSVKCPFMISSLTDKQHSISKRHRRTWSILWYITENDVKSHNQVPYQSMYYFYQHKYQTFCNCLYSKLNCHVMLCDFIYFYVFIWIPNENCYQFYIQTP